MTDSDKKNTGIKSCNEIDLRSHAVVEASAGTGKTYTITGLVIRLVLGITEPLKEPSDYSGSEMIKCWSLKGDIQPLTVDQILLSTFTNAATEEMKLRVAASLRRCSESFKNLEFLLKNLSSSDSSDKRLGNLLENMKKQSKELAVENYVFPLAAALMITALKHGSQYEPDCETNLGDDCIKAMLMALEDGEKRLSEAVINIDRTSVVTIHQFCKSMLHRFAFESGSLFRTDLMAEPDEARDYGSTREKRNFLYGDAKRSIVDYFLYKTLNESESDYEKNINALVNAAGRIDLGDENSVKNSSGEKSFSREEFETVFFKLQKSYEKLLEIFPVCDEKIITPEIAEDMFGVADCIRKRSFTKTQSQSKNKDENSLYCCIYRHLESIGCAGTNFKKFLFDRNQKNEKFLKEWVKTFNLIFMKTQPEEAKENSLLMKDYFQNVYKNLPKEFQSCCDGDEFISADIVNSLNFLIISIAADKSKMIKKTDFKLYSRIREKVKESIKVKESAPPEIPKSGKESDKIEVDDLKQYLSPGGEGENLKKWALGSKKSYIKEFSDCFTDKSKSLSDKCRKELFLEDCEIDKEIDKGNCLFKRFKDYIVLWQLKYAGRLKGRTSEFLDLKHKLTYDDLISNLATALDEEKNPQAERLAESIRRTYPVAILDEFQDTSPDQYCIFKRVYLESDKNSGNQACRLIIVGDPKQAIYSFRAADVYSYLHARDRMISPTDPSEKNNDALSSLTTNYRSNSDVIEFVNTLFSVVKSVEKKDVSESCGEECTGVNVNTENSQPAEVADIIQKTGTGCAHRSVFDHRKGKHNDGISFAPSHLPERSESEPEKEFIIHSIKDDSKSQLHLSLKNSKIPPCSENECEKLPGLVYTKCSDPAQFAADSVRYLLNGCKKAEKPQKVHHDSNGECETELSNGKTLLVDNLYKYSLKDVHASDIAILVKTGTQAAKVKKQLESYGIKSVFLSDRTSVRDSRLEVYFMEALLHALVYPTDQTAVRRLLTCPVMARSFDEMDRCFQSSTEYSDFVALLGTCIDVWEKLNFLASFYHFVSSPQVMLLHRLKNRSDGSRLLTNIMHLAERVQDMAARMPSIYSVYSWFCGLEFNSSADETVTGDRDDERIRLETQDDVVRIVTIFTSKGLEYPVVINPYLSERESKTEGKHKTNSYMWHDPEDSEKLVLSLCYDKDPPDERKNENDDEKIRLMYVALTRARLVNMILISEDEHKDGPFIDGSMKLLLERRLGIELGIESQNPKNIKALPSNYSMWSNLLEESTFESCPLPEYGDYTSVTSSSDKTPESSPGDTKTHLSSAEFKGHIDRTWHLASYSSLCHGSSVVKNSVPDVVLKEDEPESAEGANAPADTDVYTFKLDRFHFPRGATPGTFIHRLLEVVPFPQKDNLLLDDKINSMIRAEVARSYFAKSSVFEKWNNDEGLKCITDWFHQITTTLLGFGDKVFSLSDIQNEKRLPEVSFTFSLGSFNLKILNRYLRELSEQNDSADRQWLYIPEESPSSKLVTGFLTGVIDLFFEHDGKYYVLDYKSNFISFSADDYSRENMENVIIQNRYDLQFLIYSLAAWRFLKSRIKGFDFEKNFGGVLYLFVRGLEDNCGDKASETGAYYFDIAKLGNSFINTVDRIFLYNGDTRRRCEEEILEEIKMEVKE